MEQIITMSEKLNKLQIRAEILNAIKILDGGEKHTPNFLEEVLLPLKKISDTETILDILIKEIISSSDDNRFLVLSFLLENLIPKEKLESELWQILNQSDITDTVKASVITILRDLGNQINYEKYTEYFENPDAIVDSDTEKMLQRAISNPEALIDFLDFMEALPETDRSLLIDSLCEDYCGDELANLFSPVLYANPNSELCKYAIKKLGESKSKLAITPLNFILDYIKNGEINSLAKKSLTELKLAGARNDSTYEFYEKAFADSKLRDIFTSMPDGRGNIGIIISRKRENKDSIQMFAVALNDINGLIDCFGFNDITESEFQRIVNKFYSGQEKICISASLAALILKQSENLALKKNGKVAYEYICWKRIMYDASLPDDNLADILEKNLDKIDITTKDLRKLYDTTIFDKWFMFNSDNNSFNELIQSIIDEVNKTKNTAGIMSYIENLIQENFNNIWNEEHSKRIDYRLLLSAYLIDLNGLKSYANIINSIRYNKDIRQELLTNIIKVSIYEFLLREKEKQQNTIISTNIFARRNEANKTLIDKKTLNLLIEECEKKWSI